MLPRLQGPPGIRPPEPSPRSVAEVLGPRPGPPPAGGGGGGAGGGAPALPRAADDPTWARPRVPRQHAARGVWLSSNYTRVIQSRMSATGFGARAVLALTRLSYRH